MQPFDQLLKLEKSQLVEIISQLLMEKAKLETDLEACKKNLPLRLAGFEEDILLRICANPGLRLNSTIFFDEIESLQKKDLIYTVEDDRGYCPTARGLAWVEANK